MHGFSNYKPSYNAMFDYPIINASVYIRLVLVMFQLYPQKFPFRNHHEITINSLQTIHKICHQIIFNKLQLFSGPRPGLRLRKLVVRLRKLDGALEKTTLCYWEIFGLSMGIFYGIFYVFLYWGYSIGYSFAWIAYGICKKKNLGYSLRDM